MTEDAQPIRQLGDASDVPAADPIDESVGATDAGPADEAPQGSRLKRSVDSVKTRADAVMDDLERRRAYVPVIDIAFRGVEHDVRTGGGILAGAVAFRFFLFVVPYVFVVVFAFGIGADAANTDPPISPARAASSVSPLRPSTPVPRCRG